MSTIFDVLIIGGGPAGVASALTLSRTRRRIALLDSGVYRNAQANIMNNVPGFDGTSAHEYRARIQKELQDRYGETATIYRRTIVGIVREKANSGRELFRAKDDQGDEYVGRKVVLATGIQDVLPEIPGFRDFWGSSIIHCVYCHGTETRGQAIGVILNSDLSSPQAAGINAYTLSMMSRKFNNLNNEITILTNGIFGESGKVEPNAPAGITQEFIDVANVRGYKWDVRPISSFSATQEPAMSNPKHAHAPPTTVTFATGSSISFPYFLHVPFTIVSPQLLPLLSGAADQLNPLTPLADAVTNSVNPKFKVAMGEIPVNPLYQTSVPGVYAAGNAALFFGTVVMCLAQGQLAALGVDEELGAEDEKAALQNAT